VDPKRLVSSWTSSPRRTHSPQPSMGQSAQGGEGLWGGSEELDQEERDTHLLDQLGGDGTFDAHRRIFFGHGVLLGGLYMRDVLAAPQLNSAQMILMANLSVDKSRWVRGNLSKREGVPAVARGELLTGLQPNRRSLFSKVKNLL
jgi:hypothetical protein